MVLFVFVKVYFLHLFSDRAAVFSKIKLMNRKLCSSWFVTIYLTKTNFKWRIKKLTLPKELSVETTAPDASKTFTYWLRTVNDYIDYLGEGRAEDAPAINRVRIIISCLSPSIYPLVEEDEAFEHIVATLKAAYIKKKNNVHARHLLVSRHKQPGESVTEYAQTSKALAKECAFGAATSDEYGAELTRVTFINGLSLPFICQRILEKD